MIEHILKQIERLPPMPAVAVQLLDAAQNPDVNLAHIAALIERDPAMTANLLRACNSPYYGIRREVTSVRQATSLLGLRKVVQVAITVMAAGYLTPSQSGYALTSGELWRSSVTAAIAAELLAREVRYANSSTAYTAGLLQDMGKIVLADFLADVLPEVREKIEQGGMDWEEAERLVVGVPHPEVGAQLLERWGFPKALVESVRFHHHPSKARLDPMLAHISHLADALTMTVGVGLGADGLAYALDDASVAALGLETPGKVEELLQQLVEQVRSADELLGSPGANG